MSMETAKQTVASTLSSNTTAYAKGFMAGLSDSDFIRYSSSNPYDRRKQTGKDWELGKKAGVDLRCTCGAEYAVNVLSEMKEIA
jgi:hypothetical protein